MSDRPAGPRRPPPEALVLGIDLEEVYFVFGEELQVAGTGLPPAHYDLVEAKARRVLDILIRLGQPVELVQTFEGITSRIHRAGDPLPRGLDLRGFAERTAHDERRLSALMGAIRDDLAKPDGVLYDVGVMATRLHLCLRLVIAAADRSSPEAERYWELYHRELGRVVPIVSMMLGALAASADAGRALDAQLYEALTRLAGYLKAWDGGSLSWCAEARQRLDRVFDMTGAMLRQPIGWSPAQPAGPPAAPPESTAARDAAATALDERRQRLMQRMERDPVAAETGLRQLLAECRRALGEGHPVTLLVQGNLCTALLVLGRHELAADLAYDLADAAERHLGTQSRYTANLQVHALFILAGSRPFQEAYDFTTARLRWLAQADPATLHPDLRGIQDRLFEIIGRPGRRPRGRRRRRG